MRKPFVTAAVIAAALLTGAAIAQQRLTRAAPAAAPSATTSKTIAYGSDALQHLDFYPSLSGDRAPLVVFVHGGGWRRGDKAMMRGSAKLARWQAQGYAVASLNYRLVPKNRVEDQAADVAAAVALLRRQSATLGIDADRIVLVGHSAGAHLVALVGTDPQWLRGEGLGLDAVRGILPLDGAAYHVPSQLTDGARFMGGAYKQAFGDNAARQLALSPTAHAAAPNAPAFLILHVDGRVDTKRQSEGLANALRQASTPVLLRSVTGRGLVGHIEINRRMGDPAYPATAIVDEWLAERFAQR